MSGSSEEQSNESAVDEAQAQTETPSLFRLIFKDVIKYTGIVGGFAFFATFTGIVAYVQQSLNEQEKIELEQEAVADGCSLEYGQADTKTGHTDIASVYDCETEETEEKINNALANQPIITSESAYYGCVVGAGIFGCVFIAVLLWSLYQNLGKFVYQHVSQDTEADGQELAERSPSRSPSASSD